MRRILILSVLMLFFVSGVSADILSINSGGSSGVVLNPSQIIEGFFFGENHLPVVSNVVLYSTYGTNTTNENLTVSYSSIDADGDIITNITDWRVDSSSLNVLNMPFDTRIISRDANIIRDYSTYENNGTLGGGIVANIPTYEENCQIGGCYNFDGVDDYIEVPHSISTDSYTAVAWLYPVSSDNDEGYGQTYLSTSYPQSPGTPYEMWLLINGGTNVRAYAYTSSTSSYYQTSSNPINLNQWNFVAVTATRGGQISIYVNGNYIGSGSAGSDAWDSSRFIIGDLRMGRHINFNGSIDNVQVFDRILSEGQIDEIYQAGLNGNNLEKIVSNETSVGEIWQVAVTANDKFGDSQTVLSNELEIINNPPQDANPVLVSADLSNESDANLNCSFDVIDFDSLTMDVSVDWIKNNVSQFVNNYSGVSNGTSFLDVLDSGNLTLGDIWKCSVRFSDGYDYSNWVDSNELEIIDITNPIVNIISPQPTNYSTVNVDFNVSVIENENVSMCFYDLDDLGNVSMNEVNDSWFFSQPILGPGPHDVWFYCNDTSNNWGSNFTNFSIDNEAAIAISLSDNLTDAIRWNVVTLPANDLDALGNNFNGTTDYYINVSATNTLVDIYVKADGDLFNVGGDSIGLGNETFAVNYTDSTVPGGANFTMGTNYTLIGASIGDNSTIYMKFYLDAPVGQAAGQYFNQLNFKAVREGQSVN